MLCFRRWSFGSWSSHTNDLDLINPIKDSRLFLNTAISHSGFIYGWQFNIYMFDDDSEMMVLNRRTLENCGGILRYHNNWEGVLLAFSGQDQRSRHFESAGQSFTTRLPHLVQFSNVPIKCSREWETTL